MQAIQEPLPLAVIRGEPVKAFPKDLFIPPEALEVFLESFEGPLDLLLYLIRKQKLDVVDLPIHAITEQYLEYVAYLQGSKVELAADYLVMAATLAEIKSRLLLPRPELGVEEEEDPRWQLIRQLKAYEVIKEAQSQLDQLPRLERDFFQARATPADNIKPELLPVDVSLSDLARAFSGVLKRVAVHEHHHIEREVLSTRERMTQILAKLKGQDYLPFDALFELSEGRSGVVVSFLALMELVKELLVELIQAEPFSLIHVKAY
ncbi:segregation and condensation protein A [Shewanella surugensis]|uniref:Segregation and condensation protein A n=1 Tax=Shewanella surugensis TaxID=212020 RepID=A0ABT0LIJ2_9GAMM|nr:ScpA family protein [Shewanella surugensis]MCL1126951.1 segregation/condensation protein A [Shewanella surugensis]